MTEPTTTEKIDAMLAWLDEGTLGHVDVRPPVAYGNDLYVGENWIGETINVRTGNEVCEINARNIAALLNGIRPALEAAKVAWEHSGSMQRDELLDEIIEPLWQAFKEARDA